MPHGYTLDYDNHDKCMYRKMHKNGDETKVLIERDGNDNWIGEVMDPNGRQSLGTFGTKTDAKRKAKDWMRDHPKGVPASGRGISGSGGAIPGQDTGIPGTDGNGLF